MRDLNKRIYNGLYHSVMNENIKKAIISKNSMLVNSPPQCNKDIAGHTCS